MNSSQSFSSFAERVRDIRSRMHMTQAQFAERMAVTPLTVHRWETGQSRPRALALERLQALEEAASNREASDYLEAAHPLPTSRVPSGFRRGPCRGSAGRGSLAPGPRTPVQRRLRERDGPDRSAAASAHRGVRADAAAGPATLPARGRRRCRQDHHDRALRARDVVPATDSPSADRPPGRARGQLGAGAAHPVPTAMPHRVGNRLSRWCEPVCRNGRRPGHRVS